jgi:hypothetical protein
MGMGSTHAKISSRPFSSQSRISSSVAQVSKASLRVRQHFPHCLHLKPDGGIILFQGKFEESFKMDRLANYQGVLKLHYSLKPGIHVKSILDQIQGVDATNTIVQIHVTLNLTQNRIHP